MRVHLGGDHAAYELKQRLVAWLQEAGHEAVDHGPPTYDPQDDYPPYVLRAAVAVAADRGSLGVVLGGSGNGEQIAANKVAGIRAALAWNEDTASLARRHNDANVVAIGARQHTIDEAQRLVATFLDTPYEAEERHARRLAMVGHYEATGELPPLPGASGPEAEEALPVG